ncbi:DUF6366 family protein [Oceanobacillus luteolus]|uniref:DUF6366 family protein n=1 Tax=Oceanobacillus luteolus TaxID=1274358 RepID=A0ABW4HN68_9BACI|nr:DUF6366 family protein [Oceanobacillus luteolus]
MDINNEKKSPENMREELRQKEVKHPASSMKGNNLADLVGGANWKISGIIILLLIGILGLVWLFTK